MRTRGAAFRALLARPMQIGIHRTDSAVAPRSRQPFRTHPHHKIYQRGRIGGRARKPTKALFVPLACCERYVGEIFFLLNEPLKTRFHRSSKAWGQLPRSDLKETQQDR